MSFTDDFFGLIDGLVVVTFIIPPVVGMVQSVRASTLYMLYLIPCLISMSFYVCFIPGYALARLWELTWGNKDTGQDAVADQKRVEYDLKAREYLVWVLVANVVVFFIFVCLNDLGEVSSSLKIAGYILLLLPMGLNLAFAVVYFLMRIGAEVAAICRRGCMASETARRLRQEALLNRTYMSGGAAAYGSTLQSSSATSTPLMGANSKAAVDAHRLSSTHNRSVSDDDFGHGTNAMVPQRNRRDRDSGDPHRNRREGRSRESHRSARSNSLRSQCTDGTGRSQLQIGQANNGLREPLLPDEQRRRNVVRGYPADGTADWTGTPGWMRDPTM